MRISRLRLTAYGHFTDFELPLGDGPAVHVIVGPNEAGKSTARRGLVSALFGYPHHAEDGFKFAAKDISVGADLISQDGRPLAYNRRRRGKPALTLIDGSPLDESLLGSFTGGITRELFEKVFGLSHQALREHALALVQGGGSLGYSLTEAATGVSGLKATLATLGEERAGLFKSAGSVPTINRLISRHRELSSMARQRAISVTAYGKQIAELSTAEAEVKRLKQLQTSLANDLRRLERIKGNLIRFTQRAKFKTEREEIGTVADLPDDAAELLTRAETRRASSATAITREDATIASLEREIAEIAPDEAILALKSKVDRLKTQRPFYESLMSDMPRRQAEMEALLTSARNLLASAELQGDPAGLVDVIPSQVKRAAITNLVAEGTRLAERETSTRLAKETSAQKVVAAEKQAEQMKAMPDITALRQVFEVAASLGKIDDDIAGRSARHAAGAKSLGQTARSLGAADIETLRAMTCPPAATISRYAEAYRRADAAIEGRKATIEQFRQDLQGKTEQLRTVESSPGFVSEEDLRQARQSRDRGWELVRAIHVDGKTDMVTAARDYASGGVLADAFSRDMTRADQAADSLRQDANAAAKHEVLRRDIEQLRGRLTNAEAQLPTDQAARNNVTAEWRALWLGFETVQPPTEMTDYVARRDRTLAEADKLAVEEADIGTLTAQRDAQARELAAALGQLGIRNTGSETFDALRQAARLAIETHQQQSRDNERLQQGLESARSALEEASGAAKNAERDLQDWQTRWRAALAGAALPETLTREQASAVNDVFNKLLVEQRSIEGLATRMASIARERDKFQKSVSELAGMLGDKPEPDPAVQCLAFERRLELAAKAEADRVRIDNELKQRRSAREEAQKEFDENNGVIDGLCRKAGCESAELSEVISRSRKGVGLDSRIRQIEEDLVASGGGLDLEALFRECDGLNGDGVISEIERKTTEADEVQATLQGAMDLAAQLRAVIAQIAAGDQSLDALQETAICEAELGQSVQRYVDITLEETMLRRAIESYRSKNEGPLVGRAKSLFQELTNGTYTGIRVDIDESDQPIILAEHVEGRSLEVHELSDGAQDSLYLALRFAVIEEHNSKSEPIPFVADDLLLNLDNARAGAAFRVLARIAISGQVLLFTHHDHMVPLAQAAVPSEMLKVSRLDGPVLPRPQ